MPIEKVLIEFAKLQLQLIAANEQIAALQAQIKEQQASVKSAPEQN
jgi:multidrug resistance efflux pump